MRWTNSYSGDLIGTGRITADLSGEREGWLLFQSSWLEQRIILMPQRRHFGGWQWYFMCPVMNRPVSVLWKPPGAYRFCSRQTWGRQVAYQSQFSDPNNRAHLGKAKIKARLIGDRDPEEWDLPPKPKWMRWSTYRRYVERYDHYEAILDYGCVALVTKLGKYFA